MRARMRRPEPIGDVLAAVIRDLGCGKKLKEQRAVVEWADIVGRQVAEHTRAVRVDGGRLFIEVDSSVWAQELSLMRRKIRREVNERVGNEAIEYVHFVLRGSDRDDASSGRDREEA